MLYFVTCFDQKTIHFVELARTRTRDHQPPPKGAGSIYDDFSAGIGVIN